MFKFVSDGDVQRAPLGLMLLSSWASSVVDQDDFEIGWHSSLVFLFLSVPTFSCCKLQLRHYASVK